LAVRKHIRSFVDLPAALGFRQKLERRHAGRIGPEQFLRILKLLRRIFLAAAKKKLSDIGVAHKAFPPAVAGKSLILRSKSHLYCLQSR